MALALPVVALMTSCEPSALTEGEVLVTSEDQLMKELAEANPEGYDIININTLLQPPYMTEQGNFKSDSSLYRTRSTYKDMQLFSIDTLPTNGRGIYIRGRIATDDYGGNFYKTLVIQQVNDWETAGYPTIDQQGLRLSVDMGSASGMYHQGQEIIVRCNGLAIGRYANEPQLCVPTYNNNIYANSYEQKVGWAPGRIPSARFRLATRMIGHPDKSKLVYEVMDLTTLHNNYLSKYQDVKVARLADARLVKITDVHFSCTYDSLGAEKNCNKYDPAVNETLGNPELDQYAATFGPTTGNVGYPQSRYVKDAGDAHKVLIGTSEYAKYAYFYLPAAKYIGTITGVLGYYMDNGKYDPDGGEWSITPCNIGDILPEAQATGANPQWVPVEWKKGTAQPVE